MSGQHLETQALLVLLGVSLYLGLHHVWIWFFRRQERAFLWTGIWCFLSALYQACRYAQLESSSRAMLVAADKGAFAIAIIVVGTLVMTMRALALAPPSRRVGPIVGAVTATILIVHAMTDWFVGREVTSYANVFGGTVSFTRVGPLYAPVLLLGSGATYAYGLPIVRRSTAFTRRELIAFLFAIHLYLLFGLNDILLFSGVIQGHSVFELAFAGFGVGLALLTTRRIERIQTMLEARVAEATEHLRVALDQARAAADAKSAFLANMSHEIRTPLNGVLGTTKLLLAEDLPEATRKAVETIDASGDTLLALINDVLDIAKFEAGRIDLRIAPFSLAEALRESCEIFRAQATAKGLDFEWTLEGDADRMLAGDRVRLGQVLKNLVANAVKFTDEGRIIVRAAIRDGSSGEVELVASVRDTGIGIPEDALDALFKPFSQVDSSSRRRHGGSGLGLAISRQIVDAMGGELHVESHLGEGTTFSFTVPLEIARQAPSVRPDWTSSSEIDLGPKRRVLLVEDNAVNQAVAAGLTRKMGFEVDVVTDGSDALAALESSEYHAVLMDCQMPAMDGYETTRRLRLRERETGRSRARVIALTAHALAGDRERCLAAGMDDYLTKPLDTRSLARALDAFRDALPAPADPSSTPPAPVGTRATPALDLSALDLERLASLQRYEGLADEVFPEMLESARTRVPELSAAVRVRDLRRARDLAHALKGSAATVGAARLSALFAAIERHARDATLAEAEPLLVTVAAAIDETECAFSEWRRGADARGTGLRDPNSSVMR